MKKHGKKYNEALKKFDVNKYYEPKEGLKIAKTISFANFDETIEKSNRDWSTYLSLVRDIVNDLPMMRGASQTAKEGVNLFYTMARHMQTGKFI